MRRILLLFVSVIALNISVTGTTIDSNPNIPSEEDVTRPENKIHTGLVIAIRTSLSTDQVFIKSEQNLRYANLEVLDVDGSVMMKVQFPVLSEVEVSMKSLPQGRYFIKISNARGLALMPFTRRV